MNLQHVNVKIFVDGQLSVDTEDIIKVFHRWVSEQSTDELLIDVADYRHVPAGPGVALIGHEADYGLDNTGNRYGLRYNRKAELEGSNEDRIKQAFSSVAKACQRLEEEFSGLKFCRQEFHFSINDRALAPNTAETFEACKPELDSFLKQVSPDSDFEIDYDDSDSRRLFSVTIKSSNPIDLDKLAN